MFAVTIAAAAPAGGQDRACVFERGDKVVIALADGAGGTGGGAEAAQAIVDAARTHPGDAAELLLDLDTDVQRLHGGQSTAVLLTVAAGGITGASVGDSGAWLIETTGRVHDLTASQQRKPLVGAGCSPSYVRPTPLIDGTVLVASDGLFRYAGRADIVHCVVTGASPAAIAASLVALVRLPNGELQDDVAVVIVQITRSK